MMSLAKLATSCDICSCHRIACVCVCARLLAAGSAKMLWLFVGSLLASARDVAKFDRTMIDAAARR